jgi:hypothetical protein
MDALGLPAVLRWAGAWGKIAARGRAVARKAYHRWPAGVCAERAGLIGSDG